MEQIKSYSPDYNKKKFNNYDNFVKNSQRVIHDQFEIEKNIKVPNPKHLVSKFVQSFLNIIFLLNL